MPERRETTRTETGDQAGTVPAAALATESTNAAIGRRAPEKHTPAVPKR